MKLPPWEKFSKFEPNSSGKSNTLRIENSFCTLLKFPKEVKNEIKEMLTYEDESIKYELIELSNKIEYLKKCVDYDPDNGSYRKSLGFAKKQYKEKSKKLIVCWLKGNKFPTGHLNLVKDLLKEALGEKNYKIEDLRQKPKGYVNFRWKRTPKELWKHQKEMRDIFNSVDRGVWESAVGTGKTITFTSVIFDKKVNTLVIVPSRPLLKQTFGELKNYFGANKVQKLDAQLVRKSRNFKAVRVIGVSSLRSLKKSNDLYKLVKDIDFVIFDEFHHAGSSSYTDLMEDLDHVYYRLGCTGTFVRNDCKTLDMWGVLSNLIYSYPGWKAIEDGILTPLEIRIHEVEGRRGRKYQGEYKKNYCENEILLSKIGKILQRDVKKDQQTLILVSRKDTGGEVIHNYLKDLGIDNTYISGDDKVDVIDKAITDFNEGKVKILIGSSVIGEGVDVRSTDHLIMAQGGKSEIAIVQAVGRGVRLFPGKEKAVVHDFRFMDTKYMEKHMDQRLEIYKKYFKPKVIETS